MAGLLPTILAFTALLSVGALAVSMFHLGAGSLLVLAALGEHAVWLLPLHVAIALPAALFGGALFASAGPRTADRPTVSELAGTILIVTITSTYLVGWLMPEGYRASRKSMARFQHQPVEHGNEPPAALDLPRLLQNRSPAARENLRVRIRLVAPCILLGALAIVAIASPLTWSAQVALAATLIVFIWQARYLLERFGR